MAQRQPLPRLRDVRYKNSFEKEEIFEIIVKEPTGFGK